MTNLIYPGNRTVTYFYDSLNRMTNVTDWSGRKTSIEYDLNSQITSIVRPNGSYRTIDYNAAGQATNILEQMSNSLPISIFKYNWTNTGSMAWEFAVGANDEELSEITRWMDRIERHPWDRGDYIEWDGDRRELQVVMLRTIAITYWTDDAARKVRVVRIESLGA